MTLASISIRGEEVAVVRKGKVAVVARERRRPWYWPNYRRPAAGLKIVEQPAKPCTPCAAKAARLAGEGGGAVEAATGPAAANNPNLPQAAAPAALTPAGTA